MRVVEEKPDRSLERTEGLSVWLYLLERPPGPVNLPNVGEPRVGAGMLQFKAHFLFTPCVGSGNRNAMQIEQDILEIVLRAFESRPVLRGPELAGGLEGTDAELRVHLEPLGLEGMAPIWSAAGGAHELSVSFAVDIL